MRILCALVLLLIMVACKTASKKTTYIVECQELFFDLSDGTLNGVKPNLSQSEIKEWLPCYTQFVPDGGVTHCGGALLYGNHDFYFYTYFDNYIEVKSGFKGKVSDSLLAQTRGKVREVLGATVETIHAKADSLIDFFPTEYGCIRVHYKGDKAVVIAAHFSSPEELDWCKE